MAAVTKKGILSAAYGNATDVAATIANDTSLPTGGIQDPPPGIKNGVALLDEVKFDVYKSGKNEGKPYFTAVAIIKEPTTHTYTPTAKGKPNGNPVKVHTAGMQTRIKVDIFDIKVENGPKRGTVIPWKEGAQKAAQYLRMLGGDTSRVRNVSDLEDIAVQLTRVARNPKTPIYTKFSTSIRQAMKEGEWDGVWQNWNGTDGLEDYASPDGSITHTNDQSYDEGNQSIDNIHDDNPMNDTGNENEQSGDEGQPNLEELVTQANAEGDLPDGSETPAQDELLRLASEATGKTVDEINGSAQSWEDVAEMIAGSGVSPQETQDDPAPKVGDHFNYRPLVKGIGGKQVKSKNPVECSIVKINPDGTYNLKNTVDGRTPYLNVPIDDLIELQ